MTTRYSKPVKSHSQRPRLQLVMFEGDLKMLKFIQDELGGSEADAVRTAIRTYAALLMQSKR